MKSNRVLLSSLSIALATSISGGMLTKNVTADRADLGDNNSQASIAIDETHFPDENFREIIKENYDVDNNGALSAGERNDVLWMDVSDKEIRTIKGIEYFTNIRELGCAYNEIEELDVSKNTKLEQLFCGDNKLTELDVSHNTELVNLSCGNNKFQTLDCSKNTKLQSLTCMGEFDEKDENKWYGILTSINVNGCTKLEDFSCAFNKLTSLDLSTNVNLKDLYCPNNKLTELDVSHLKSLTRLGCGYNGLTTLDVSSNKNLIYLEFENAKITDIDLGNNTNLEELRCASNDLTSLDLSKMYSLTTLVAHDNKLETLDIGKTRIADVYKKSLLEDEGTYYIFEYEYQDEETLEEISFLMTFDKTTKIKTERGNEIVCEINEKTFPDMAFRMFISNTYDLDHDKKLSDVEIARVKYMSLGLEEDDRSEGIQIIKGIEYFTSLQELRVYGTRVKEIDLGQMESLIYFEYGGGELGDDTVRGNLKKVDVSRCTNLKELIINSANVSSVDVSKNKALTTITLQNLPLKSVDITSNTNLQALNIYSCDKLAEVKTGEQPNLLSVYISNSSLTKIDVSRCPELQVLNCCDSSIKNLDVSANTKLEFLELDGTALTKLDISKNTNLTGLSCSVTDIASLDLSQNRKLESLNAAFCKLSSIDLSKNPSIRNLEVSGNSLKELDITACEQLEILNCSVNPITELDLSKNAILSELQCNNTKISKLDCSSCMKLTRVECANNPNLVDLNLKKTVVDTLDCSECPLEKLDLSHLELWSLHCGGTRIKKLNLSNQLYLSDFSAYGLGLTELDLSKCEYLVLMDLHDNLLTTLDLSRCMQLEKVDLRFNMFAEKPDYKCTDEDLFEPQKYVEQVKGLKLVSRDDKAVTISWNQAVGAEAYEVLRSENDGDDYTCVGTTSELTFTDKTAAAGQEYYYFIRGYKSLEEFDLGYWHGEPSEKLKVEASAVAPAPSDDATFEEFVERLYTVALNRESDKEGKQFWIDQVVNQGRSGADCARFFLLDADEFMKRNLSVEDFVETLYKTFFDRESDAAGKKGWVDAINSGKKTRAEVVNDFIESTEWCNVCATYGVKSGAQWHKATKASKNATNFATRLYTCCLKRDAEEGGLKYWSLALTNLEKTGAQAAQFFFESEEFAGFNTTDKEYLLRLYATFMDRQPADSEVNFWLGEIAGGRQNRHSILAFFAQSPEFTSICKKYGIERGEIA